MGDIRDSAAVAWRDYETDGVPSSGPHKPDKAEILETMGVIEDQVDLAIGISYEGVWSSGTTYAAAESVSYGGASYVSRVGSNLNNQPDVSPTQWQLLSDAGSTGAAGPAGADGVLLATRWKAAVVANGGTVSDAQHSAVNTLFDSLNACGAYDLIDDMWLLAAESETQALTSLKRRTLATATNAPVFTKRGVYFTAASSQYISTGFIPSTDADQMTGSDIGAGVYGMKNVATTTTALGCYQSTNQRLEITAQTGGGAYYFGFNAAPATFGSTTDSRGMTSYYRSGSTYGSRKNGAAGSTYTPASSASSLPTIQIFIGARNNAGTADLFTSGLLSFAYVGASLGLAQEAALYAAVQEYMRETGALDVYISETGGSDSDAGDEDHPLATWATGFGNVQDDAGATIWLDGTAATPQVYYTGSLSTTTLEKGVTVRAIEQWGAILTGTGATTSAAVVDPASGQTVELIDLIIDPTANGSATNPIFTLTLDSKATAYTLNCTRCKFQGWTGTSSYGIYSNSADFRGHVTLTDCVWIGSNVTSAINIFRMIEGGVTVVNPTITLTDQNTAGFGAIVVKAEAADCYAAVTGEIDITMSIKSSLVGGGYHYGIWIQNIAEASVSGPSPTVKGEVTINGAGSPRSALAVDIATNGAGDATELAIDGSIIENMLVYCEPSGGGLGVAIGMEGAGDETKINSCIIRHCKVTASAAAGTSGGLHGIFCHHGTDCQIVDNEVDAAGLNIVDKNSIRTIIERNKVRGSSSSSILCKGSTDSEVRNNEIVIWPSSATVAFAVHDDSTGTLNFSTGIVIDRNKVEVMGGTGNILVNVQTGSDATFSNNVYLHFAGTLATNKFLYGASTYTTFAAWYAAHGTTDAANFA